jgi:hypothetical protein
VQIVDCFHAKQHLSELGKPLYGLTAPRAFQWVDRRKKELDTGKFQALLTAIRRQVPHSEDARRCLHYFQTNRERMRYPEFHAQGLCTSTGVVEAGCKVASVHASNAPGCTGPFPAPTPSSRFAAQNSAAGSGLLGTQVRNPGRMIHHFLVVHPVAKLSLQLVTYWDPAIMYGIFVESLTM